MTLLRNLLHLDLGIAYIIRSRRLLLLHILQSFVHRASRLTDASSRLFKSRFGDRHALVSGLFGRGWNGDVELEGIVGVWLRGQR